MCETYTKHAGYAFSQAFKTATLLELKQRYAAGERPHIFAYISITYRPYGLDEQLDVLAWLLNTDFEDPTGDLWLFVAGTPNSAAYAEVVLKARPATDCAVIAYHAIDNFDRPLLEFAASRTGWKEEYIVRIEERPFGGSTTRELRAAWNSFRTWVLKKCGHTEGSFLAWKLRPWRAENVSN